MNRQHRRAEKRHADKLNKPIPEVDPTIISGTVECSQFKRHLGASIVLGMPYTKESAVELKPGEDLYKRVAMSCSLGLLQFETGEWTYVSGRGNIFITQMPKTINYSLLDSDVIIQGKVYTVIGVEMPTQNWNMDMSLVEGRRVGLLIRGGV